MTDRISKTITKIRVTKISPMDDCKKSKVIREKHFETNGQKSANLLHHMLISSKTKQSHFAISAAKHPPLGSSCICRASTFSTLTASAYGLQSSGAVQNRPALSAALNSSTPAATNRVPSSSGVASSYLRTSGTTYADTATDLIPSRSLE
ncbi:hypothetical protein SUNI508_04043 [Seiridium unicorne]|uniref:Uncharacterized protein n=1 Tax=Seiridium unicorne TaxID=138068 RepID=A0ABR2V9G9_9PEZI